MSTGTNKERLTTNNGIITDNNADLNALKTRINNLPTSGDTTATASDIALGKTAVSKGVKITGTYTPPTVSLQSKDVTINQNGTTTITADTGYDGLSDVDVTVSGILDTSDANATANNIEYEKTAYVNGQKITGTLSKSGWVQPRFGAMAKIPAVNPNQIYIDINFDTLGSSKMIIDGTTRGSAYMPYWKLAPYVDASAEKIKKDEVICGVTGTYEGASEAEEKDVNFYDYDGFRVYSYTKSEFLALQSMPANPTHEGLTAQGWNWSLADAQDFVTANGMLDVGQMYVTDDGATRLYITLNYRKIIYLRFAINGTATINWGDNSATEQITGTSTSTALEISHEYNIIGNYAISISSENPIFDVSCSDITGTIELCKKIETGTNLTTLPRITNHYRLEAIVLSNNITTLQNQSLISSNIQHLTIPNSITNVNLGMFLDCSALKTMSFPNSITSVTGNFQGAKSITSLIMPSSINSISNNFFTDLQKLRKLVLPNKMTQIQCSYCFSLEYLFIPKTVTSVYVYSFGEMKIYDFSSNTSIPTITAYSFDGIPADCKIIVPDALYEDWIVANNWSSLASQIVKASEA